MSAQVDEDNVEQRIKVWGEYGKGRANKMLILVQSNLIAVRIRGVNITLLDVCRDGSDTLWSRGTCGHPGWHLEPILAGMWELWAGVKVPGAKLEGKGTREEQGRTRDHRHICAGAGRDIKGFHLN